MATIVHYIRFFSGTTFLTIYSLIFGFNFILTLVVLCEASDMVFHSSNEYRKLPMAALIIVSLLTPIVVDDFGVATGIAMTVLALHWGSTYGYKLFEKILTNYRNPSNIDEIDFTHFGWVMPDVLRLIFLLCVHLSGFLFFCTLLTMIVRSFSSEDILKMTILYLPLLALTVGTAMTLSSFTSDWVRLVQRRQNQNKEDESDA